MPDFATSSVHDVRRVQARAIAVPAHDYPDGYVCLTLRLTGDDERPIEIALYLPIDRAVYAARLAHAIDEVAASDCCAPVPDRRSCSRASEPKPA